MSTCTLNEYENELPTEFINVNVIVMLEAAPYRGVEYGTGESDCGLGAHCTPTEGRRDKSDC